MTQARAVTLTQQRHTAEAQATQALAKAIREGKGEEAVAAKVEKETARIDKEEGACERRLLAIEEALDSAELDLIEVVDANRETWLGETEAKVDAAYDEYRSSVAVLAEKRGALSRVHALRSWLSGFPDNVESYKVGQGVLPKLRGQNGSPYAVQQVIDALTEDANPAAPEPIVPFQPLLPRLTSGVVRVASTCLHRNDLHVSSHVARSRDRRRSPLCRPALESTRERSTLRRSSFSDESARSGCPLARHPR